MSGPNQLTVMLQTKEVGQSMFYRQTFGFIFQSKDPGIGNTTGNKCL